MKPNENLRRPHHDSCLPPGGVTSATAFGPITGPVGSIMWLPATACTKIGAHSDGINRRERTDLMASTLLTPTLLTAIAALVAWALLIFGGVTSSGVTHLLLPVGTVLLVRWWALRA